ncbi:DUF481 domain-containing protein [Halopseudomonas sp.]|uniref:DUF481 domain-containing protein n=1 Tax=Halopseudomonas sp. TaxID=2901191 RepID=UPI001A421961|nr:DUF481 domain-containing protein [Pseudomonas sp.]
MSVYQVCLSAFLILLCPAISHADTLLLKNGDRLTGTIELLEDGKLYILTDLAGRVTVKVQHISTLEASDDLLVKTAGEVRRVSAVHLSDVDGQVLLSTRDDRAQALNLASIEQMQRPKAVVDDWVWDGRATVALDIKNDSAEQQDLDVGFDTRARHGDWRHEVAGEFELQYRDDVKKRHQMRADYDLNRFFTEQWFWQTSVSYQRDRLGDIKRRRQFGMGPGYEWWDNALGRFETSARLDHVKLEGRDEFSRSLAVLERNGSSRNFNAIALEWHLRRLLFARNVEVFHNAETLIPDDPAVNFALDTEVGLRYLLNSWASLSLLAEWDYLSSNREESVNDTRYRFGLGVSW